MIDEAYLKNLIKESLREVLTEFNNSKSTSEELVSLKELMVKLDCARSTIQGWRDQGKLKAKYIGSKPYFIWSEVLSVLEEKNRDK